MSAEADFYSGIQKYRALVVGSNKNLLHQLRSALKSIGFSRVDPYGTCSEALDRAKDSSTTHILFELEENSEMSPVSFVEEVVKTNANATLVTISKDPGLDNVFDLLRSGARGFLIPPPTMESVESVFIAATKGPPISENILKAEDRNKAFTELVLNSLYRLATTMSLARQSETAANAVGRCYAQFEQAVNIARMFCEEGEDALRDRIVEQCIERATEQKTRLGEVRKALKKARGTN